MRHAIACLSLIVLALSGCVTAAPDPQLADIEVLTENVTFELAPAPDGSIPAAQRTELAGFISHWQEQAQGPLLVNAGGLSPAARTRLLAQLNEAVRLNGGGPAAVTLTPGIADLGGAMLSFQMAVIVQPQCEPGFGPGLNTGIIPFGCATRANIAAMVANPGDLAQPNLEPGTNGVRGARVIGAHRQGQPTWSAQTPGSLSSQSTGGQ